MCAIDTFKNILCTSDKVDIDRFLFVWNNMKMICGNTVHYAYLIKNIVQKLRTITYTALILDTFYVKYCPILASTRKLTSISGQFSSVSIKTVLLHLNYILFHATKNLCLRLFLNKRPNWPSLRENILREYLIFTCLIKLLILLQNVG